MTEQILNILDKYHAKATFFMLGSRVQYYPDIVKDVLARGHEIGNHSWNHPVLTKLPQEQVMKEYNTTATEIEKAINQGATVLDRHTAQLMTQLTLKFLFLLCYGRLIH